MTRLDVEFAEFLTIKSALQAAVTEAYHQAWRGNLHGNADMQAHFKEYAHKLTALIEKLDGQAKA